MRKCAIAISSSLLLAPLSGAFAPSAFAQSSEDIIQIGDSPDEWQQYQIYWDQLRDLSDQAAPNRQPSPVQQAEAEPQIDLEELAENLEIRDIFLAPILKLNGSSQLSGLLTNKNKVPVTVTAVNFEILDDRDDLIQTGSAQPEPSTIAPGQTVTFTKVLLTIPADDDYQVRLTEPVFVLAPQ